MKKSLTLPLLTLTIATLLLSLSSLKNDDELKEEFRVKTEKWRSINRSEISHTLFNSKGQLLNSVSLSRNDIVEILKDESQDIIELKLAINELGQLCLIANNSVLTKAASFESELPTIQKASDDFDLDLYRKMAQTLDPKAQDHIIDLLLAIVEIENWQTANISNLTNAFFLNDNTRITSIAYHREVLESALTNTRMRSFTSFLAINDKNEISLVSIPRGESGNLLLPGEGNEVSSNNFLFNWPWPCPPCIPPKATN